MKTHHWLSGLIPIIQLTVKSIEAEKSTINDLNVFPVPDGDTGTNIAATLSGMLTDVSKLPPSVHPDLLLDTIASSALRHSRGNSGVILAAMIRGATEALKNTEELTVELLAHMLTSADASGRHATPKPTEGTMITVARVMAEEATRLHKSGETSVAEAAKSILAAGVFATKETHKAMAVLVGKDQVDSGAYALSIIARSLYQYSIDKVIGGVMDWAGIDLGRPPATTSSTTYDDNLHWQPGTPLYCTEFLWHWRAAKKPTAQTIHKYLASLGDSIQFVASTDLAKVHVHTDTPDRIIRYFTRYGELSEVEIHNMRIQTEEHQQRLTVSREPSRPLGIVAVAQGEGMHNILYDLGADAVVDGGQTANPTTGTIADAISSVNAERIIVLPGNKNIVLAASSAAKLCDKPCAVIPTRNIPQSLAALLEISECDPATTNFDDIVSRVTDAALSPNLRVASISIATNDYTSPAGLQVRLGQFIVIVDDEVVLATDGKQNQAILAAINYLVQNPTDASCITIYTGEDYTGEPAELENHYHYAIPSPEIMVTSGDQPVFLAIIEVQLSSH